MKKTDSQIAADKIRKGLRKTEERKASTVGLYAVRFPRTKVRPECYYGPFIAKDDDVALISLHEISRSEPAFQRKNLYCVGSYCSLDGKIKSCVPRLVLGKVTKKNENKVQN